MKNLIKMGLLAIVTSIFTVGCFGCGDGDRAHGNPDTTKGVDSPKKAIDTTKAKIDTAKKDTSKK
jgi:hypothetical protein